MCSNANEPLRACSAAHTRWDPARSTRLILSWASGSHRLICMFSLLQFLKPQFLRSSIAHCNFRIDDGADRSEKENIFREAGISLNLSSDIRRSMMDVFKLLLIRSYQQELFCFTDTWQVKNTLKLNKYSQIKCRGWQGQVAHAAERGREPGGTEAHPPQHSGEASTYYVLRKAICTRGTPWALGRTICILRIAADAGRGGGNHCQAGGRRELPHFEY